MKERRSECETSTAFAFLLRRLTALHSLRLLCVGIGGSFVVWLEGGLPKIAPTPEKALGGAWGPWRFRIYPVEGGAAGGSLLAATGRFPARQHPPWSVWGRPAGASVARGGAGFPSIKVGEWFARW